jgi:hypothetical protein
MPVSLDATVIVQEAVPHIGKPLGVKFTVINQTNSPVSIVNPYVGMPPAEMNWAFSNETYQIAVLLSFHLMKISIVDFSGKELAMTGPNSWVTPILLPRLELASGDSFTVQINLADHFELQHTGRYDVTIEYGDEHAFAHANTQLLIV